MQATQTVKKGYKGFPMEGMVAHWYAKIRGTTSQVEDWKRQAVQLTSDLPSGASILEIAPGPGYFAIEMARLGRFHVTGLDISRTFVDIARANAQRAGVSVDFQLGDASNLPFKGELFDLIICQAAFKNFSRPREVIDEMYRVLRFGGAAVIEDMNRNISGADIDQEVQRMRLGALNAFMTRRSLGSLQRRAYAPEQFEGLASASAFGGCLVETSGIGLQVWLKKAVRQSERTSA